jgi:hypothetical protein
MEDLWVADLSGAEEGGLCKDTGDDCSFTTFSGN